MNTHRITATLLKTIFESEHVPVLIAGEQTHDATLRFVGSLVRSVDDDGLIEKLVSSSLPVVYNGDTLRELPEMILSAREKGFGVYGPVGGLSLGFTMTERGLFFVEETQKGLKTHHVSAAFELLGLVRDSDGRSWSSYLRWKDHDHRSHTYIANHKVLLSDHEVAVGEMSDRGLQVFKQQQVKLASYVLQTTSDMRVTLTHKTGWLQVAGKNTFVLPNKIVGDPSEPVVYEGDDEKQNEFEARGTLYEWRSTVSIPAGEHVLALVAISAAFAAPLLLPAEQESGGLHIFGNSSTGKTTLLKLATSVWGSAGLLRSWRATANGLEGVASRTNDVVLILDEIGQLDSRDAANALYMLASGVGKLRMTRTAKLQDIKTWRVFTLSSGEMTVETKINQLRGATAYTGAALRMINVAADRGFGFGVLDHGGPTGNSGELVKQLTQAIARNYGTSGPAFVEAIVSTPDAGERVRAHVHKFVAATVSAGADGQLERAAKRFGLIAAAGELATEFGITGWRPGSADEAAQEAFAKWAEARGGDGKEPAEDRKAILHVANLIVRYGESRFDELDREGYSVTETSDESGETVAYQRPALIRYGWRKYEGDQRIWLIDDSTWESEICRGFDPIQVSRALARHGLLKCAKGRFTYAEPFQGKRNKRFHVITAKILNTDYDRTEDEAPDDDYDDAGARRAKY